LSILIGRSCRCYIVLLFIIIWFHVPLSQDRESVATSYACIGDGRLRGAYYIKLNSVLCGAANGLWPDCLTPTTNGTLRYWIGERRTENRAAFCITFFFPSTVPLPLSTVGNRWVILYLLRIYVFPRHCLAFIC